jgi:hypothetical protein
LVRFLWLVSPTFKAKFQFRPVPSIGDPSEVEQYGDVRRRISSYCLSADNADDIQNTFFFARGDDRTDYNEWLAKFRERAVDGTEGN